MQYDLTKTDPQIQAVVKMLPPMFTEFIITRESLNEFRILADKLIPEKPFESDFATRKKILAETPERTIELYHYQPIQKTENSSSIIFWIHGGGYVRGTAKDEGPILPFVQNLACQVISVEYRLAPEHPFPAGHNDCLNAYKWLLNNAENLGIDKNKIAIAGSSAGGGLAAGLGLKIRDEGLARPACQYLNAPMIDNLCETPSSNVKGYPLWKSETNKNSWEMYLNGSPGKDASPYAAASRANEVNNLAPTLITVGDQDAFCDENKIFAERLNEQGVEATCKVYPGVIHGSDAIARHADVVQQMNTDVFDFLKKHIL